MTLYLTDRLRKKSNKHHLVYYFFTPYLFLRIPSLCLTGLRSTGCCIEEFRDHFSAPPVTKLTSHTFVPAIYSHSTFRHTPNHHYHHQDFLSKRASKSSSCPEQDQRHRKPSPLPLAGPFTSTNAGSYHPVRLSPQYPTPASLHWPDACIRPGPPKERIVPTPIIYCCYLPGASSIKGRLAPCMYRLSPAYSSYYYLGVSYWGL